MMAIALQSNAKECKTSEPVTINLIWQSTGIINLLSKVKPRKIIIN